LARVQPLLFGHRSLALAICQEGRFTAAHLTPTHTRDFHAFANGTAEHAHPNANTLSYGDAHPYGSALSNGHRAAHCAP